MVIDRGAFLSGDYAKVFDEIVATKEACGAAHLKVILETGELGTYDIVRRRACSRSPPAPTSSRRRPARSTRPRRCRSRSCMLEAIRDFHEETGRRIGIKAAGGVRTAKQALQYLVLVNETLGAGLAHARPLPLRRVVAPERRPHAAREGEDRRTTRPRLLHDRLIDARREQAETSASPLPRTEAWDVRAGARVARRRHARARATALFIGGEWLAPSARRSRRSRPRTEETLAEVAEANGRGRRRRGRGGARRVRERLVDAARLGAREVPLPHRAHPPGAGARARRARVDGRRQADQGVARRRPPARGGALLLLRGLGRQARVRVPGPRARAARRRRADHPVELPAADGRVEARARARVRQHRRAEAGGDDAAHGAAASRDHRRRRSCRPASSTSSPARARPAPRSSRIPTSTRSRSPARPRSARRSSARSPARGKKLTLELGGKAANIVFDDAPIDQAVEGIVNGIYFNQGHVCCAGSRLLRAGVDLRAARRQAEATASRRCASAIRSTRTPTSARSTRKMQLEKISELVAAGEEEGAEIYQPPCRLPEKGYWFAPTFFTGVSQSIASRARRSSARCSRCSRSARPRRRSRRRTTRRTASAPASGRTRARASSGWRSSCGPASSGRTRTTSSTRRSPFGGYKETGFGREGGRHGLEPYLRFDE